MNYHRNHKYFELSISGNILAEILREVDMAREAFSEKDPIGANVHLEYVQTILEDACFQYGSNAVFGCLEASK